MIYARRQRDVQAMLARTIAVAAASCPDCDVGVAARQLFFRDDFAVNASAVVIPFLFIAFVARWAERVEKLP